MKKFMAIFVAFLVAVGAVLCTERVHTGYVGVVYSAKGVEQQTISQGWHFMSPLKHVSEFPITQQRVVFSNAPSDYGAKEHADWHIDAPANGGTIAINLTVNYNFLPEHVVELYTKFGGMDGESLMESKIQNDIIAYVKEVTPQFYVYNIAGVEDSIVKMFNTDTGAMGEKSVKKDRMDGFIDGIKTSGFVLNKELADADVAEAEAKRVLAEKMTAYQAARDDYHSKSETLKKVKAKYGIK